MSVKKWQLRELIFKQFQLGHNATEAARNICAMTGKASTTDRTCQRWFAKFRSGNTHRKDKKRSGRPSTINKRALRRAIEADPSKTTRQLAPELHSSQSTVNRHLHKIGKKNKRGQTIPHELNETQKNRRVSDCRWLLHKFSRSGLERILTCDEKWVVYDNRKAKNQWLGPGQVGDRTPRSDPHQKKVMLSIWWMASGPVHWELLPRGQTITSEVYCAQLDRVQAALRLRGIDPARVCFQQDNAKPHTSRRTLAKLNELGWDVLKHPPYSPDIAPSDYHLFRSLEHFLRDRCFTEDRHVEVTLTEFFDQKPPVFYRRGIFLLPSRWRHIIEKNGEYINK